MLGELYRKSVIRALVEPRDKSFYDETRPHLQIGELRNELRIEIPIWTFWTYRKSIKLWGPILLGKVCYSPDWTKPWTGDIPSAACALGGS